MNVHPDMLVASLSEPLFETLFKSLFETLFLSYIILADTIFGLVSITLHDKRVRRGAESTPKHFKIPAFCSLEA